MREGFAAKNHLTHTGCQRLFHMRKKRRPDGHMCALLRRDFRKSRHHRGREWARDACLMCLSSLCQKGLYRFLPQMVQNAFRHHASLIGCRYVCKCEPCIAKTAHLLLYLFRTRHVRFGFFHEDIRHNRHRMPLIIGSGERQCLPGSRCQGEIEWDLSLQILHCK